MKRLVTILSCCVPIVLSCSGDGGGSDATTGGDTASEQVATEGACADLRTCGDAPAAAAIKAVCNQIADAGNEATCAVNLSNFRAAGYCP
jgi:hypothetical protein